MWKPIEQSGGRYRSIFNEGDSFVPRDKRLLKVDADVR